MSWPRCAKPLTLTVLFCTLAAAGCADERKGDEAKTGAVSGEVRRNNGDKVMMGTVTFLADAGGKETPVAIEGGTYKIGNLTPGKYHVGVISVPPPAKGPFNVPKDRDPHPLPVAPPADFPTGSPINLAAKDSLLTVEVTAGAQEYHIKLPADK
jgi:hypothetical protein